MSKLTYFLSIAVLLIGCSDESSDPLFQDIKGSQVAFEVNRVANHPNVTTPNQLLKESDFTKMADGLSYSITFNEDSQALTLELAPDSLVYGSLQDMNNETLNYTLDQGLFAGGRITIWKAGESLEAEYTVYGSGVPIIKSERGILVKK